MNKLLAVGQEAARFTFQYGQIYYCYNKVLLPKKKIIYIPIWLDLLYAKRIQGGGNK